MKEYKQDQVLDHDYDGIQEYDNRLPNWWLAILYLTIAFSFFYWFYTQSFGIAPTPQERYQAELATAAEAQLARTAGQELTNETLNLMVSVPSTVENGRAVFKQFCVVCHLEQGQGSVGPNLTDSYWLHGSLPLDIHKTVYEGVTDKGMAAWGNQLGPRRVQEVVSFVLTLKNTNVTGKEPQGVQVTPEEEAALLEEAAAAASDTKMEPGADPGMAETGSGNAGDAEEPGESPAGGDGN